jgi:hypothetical protein
MPFDSTSLSETKKYTINNKKVRVLNNDVQVLLTQTERYNFLRGAPQEHIEPEECCTTYLVQKQLADFKGREDIRIREGTLSPKQKDSVQRRYNAMEDIHALTTDFIPLESLVNNPTRTDPRQNLDELLCGSETSEETGIIAVFEKNILTKIRNMYAEKKLKAHSDDPAVQAEINAVWKLIEDRVQKRINVFKAQIEALRNQIPQATSEEVAELFEIKSTSPEVTILPTQYTLDTLMGCCMGDILDGGMSTVHAIKEESLWGRFKSHWWESAAGTALSRAKSDLKQNFSTLGLIKRGYYKTPKSQLECLTDNEPPASGGKEKWFSLKPYTTGLDFLSFDPVLCLAVGKKLEERKKPSLAYDAIKWGFAVPEIVYSGVRILGELAGFVGYGVSYALESTAALIVYPARKIFPTFYNECVSHEGLSKLFDVYHQGLSNLHKYVSTNAGAFYAQALWDKQYKRKSSSVTNTDATTVSPLAQPTGDEAVDVEISDEEQHQLLLESINKPKNGLYDFLNSANPVVAVQDVAKALWAVGNSGYKFMADLYNNPPTFPRFRTDKKGIEERKLEKLKETAKQLAIMELFSDSVKQDSAPLLQSNEITVTETVEEAAEMYDSPEASAQTNIANPYSVPNEVCIVLEKIVREGFQEAPGLSTFLCGLAVAGLATGVGLIPLAGKAGHAVAAGLQAPSKWIASNMMGQSYSESIIAQMGSTFMQYKFSYLGVRAFKSGVEGDTEFFQRIMSDPAKFLVGTGICIVLGVAVSALPLIPDFSVHSEDPPGLAAYKEMMNGMLTEDKEAVHNGTIGANGVEVGFVGFKTFIFFHSLMTGKIFKEPSELTALFKLVTYLIKNKFFSSESVVEPQWDEIFKDPIFSCLQQYKDKITQKYTEIKNSLAEINANIDKDFSKGNNPEAELENATALLNKEMTRIKERPGAYTALGTVEKEKNYNYMDYVIERYNKAQFALGHYHKKINKQKFMAEFGNQYYEGSPNVLRFMYVSIIVYGGVLLNRLYKSPFEFYNRLRGQETSPYQAYRVNKSFHKDAVNVIETTSAIGGGFIDGTKTAVQYIGRGVVGTALYSIVVFPTAVASTLWNLNPFVQDKVKWANNVARIIDNAIRPLKLPTTDNLAEWSGWKKMARWSAKKASTSYNIEEAAEHVLKQVEEFKEKPQDSSSSTLGVTVALDEAIEDAKQSLSEREVLRTPREPQATLQSRSVVSCWKKAPITNLNDLANERKTPKQMAILEGLSRERNTLTNEAKTKMKKELPWHWQEVVDKHVASNRPGA